MKRHMSLYNLTERLKELAEIEKQIIDEKVMDPKTSNLDALRQEIATKKIEVEQWDTRNTALLSQNLEEYRATLDNALQSLTNIYSVLLALEKIEKMKKGYVKLIRKQFKMMQKDIKKDHSRVMAKLKKSLTKSQLKKQEIRGVIKQINRALNYKSLWRHHLRIVMNQLKKRDYKTLEQIEKSKA